MDQSRWVSLDAIKAALETLIERIELQRRQETRKVDKKQWTEDLESARALRDLVMLAVEGEVIL